MLAQQPTETLRLNIGAEGPRPLPVTEASQPLLFSVEQCATMLGVHRTTVYDLIANQSLASVKVGRRRLISRAAMQRFIEASEQGGPDGG
jgi:excisionase family DNA binding protein